jgi:hypothetical protein
MRSGMRAVAAMSGLVVLVFCACGPPPFVVRVTYPGTYPGDVDVERGSPVLYQGVQIGRVHSIALRQEEPREAAVIEVTLEVNEPAVVLREDDRFHLATHRGLSVIEIEPWPERSPPLPAGSRVAGVPRLVTRVEDSVGAAIESIGELVVDAVQAARDEFEQSREDARVSPSPNSPSSSNRPGDQEPSR